MFIFNREFHELRTAYLSETHYTFHHRDVHIYRLISANTIEENILKKANQKRLLGAVAIEEGNFTTAFFKKDNMADIFGKGLIKPDKTMDSPKHRTISKMDLEKVSFD